MAPTPVYLEIGSKKVFACAVDWPGWCRSGKTEDVALEALAAYGARYAVVPAEAGVRFAKTAKSSFVAVERVEGSSTTDFGAPGAVPRLDEEPLTAGEAARAAKLLDASWAVFDRVVKNAPASLRKGPRGGGRDRDKMIAHVVAAEEGYARKLGVRPHDRDAILDAVSTSAGKTLLLDKGWPPRYAVRRMAWHVLDHAWEIEDRSE